MYGKVLLLESRGKLVIGIDSLLNKNKNEIQQSRASYH